MLMSEEAEPERLTWTCLWSEQLQSSPYAPDSKPPSCNFVFYTRDPESVPDMRLYSDPLNKLTLVKHPNNIDIQKRY